MAEPLFIVRPNPILTILKTIFVLAATALVVFVGFMLLLVAVLSGFN